MFFVLALTVLWGLLPVGASAQVKLDWQRQAGAEACPDAANMRALVVARVGAGLLSEGDGATRALEGEVAKAFPGHRVHIRLREQTGELVGERVLVDGAADCAALTEATALAIALLFESAPPTPKAPDGPAPTAAAVAQERPLVPQPRHATSSPWQYELAAGALGSIGLLPAPRAHAFLRLRVAPTQTYALELALVALGAARVRLGGDSPASARFSTTQAWLAGCRTIGRSGRLGLAACAGLVAGVLRADGSGFSERDYHRRAPLLAGNARMRSELTLLGPLSASLGIGLAVPFVHTSFVALDTSGRPRELTHTRPLFGTLELALGARF